MGTSEFAVPALHAVAEACDVRAVVTRPDRPSGRGRHVSASPVAEAAVALGLETLKPERPNASEWVERLAACDADLFAVVAYGAILKPALLAVPRLGCINLHGSLLPRYRGASPVQHALWDGLGGTGVTTLWMDEGVDTGDVILQRWEAVREDDDAATLGARLAAVGAPLLAESARLACAGTAPRRAQPPSGSYARKLEKHDGFVDWSLDAATVWNRQRAVTPWPGAAAWFGGKRLVLVRTRPHAASGEPGTLVALAPDGPVVACGRGALVLTQVVPEGRAAMDGAAWARGARVAPGVRFDPPPTGDAR